MRLNDPAPKLPLGIFEAQPVVGKRIVILNFQVESGNELSVVITGNTWNFRTRLDNLGVSGGYTGDDQDRKYFRVLKNVDVSSEEQTKRVQDMIDDSVFKGLAMRATVDREPEADTRVSDFLAQLRECSSLHFIPATSGAV